MFAVQNISVVFSGKTLFSNVSFLINEKDRIGLVGRNGAGKTTLLRVITGELSPDSGEIIIPQGKTIGYLPQELDVTDSVDIFTETMSAFDEIKSLEQEIAALNDFFATNYDYESKEYTRKIDRLQHLNERLLLLDAGGAEGRAEKVLLGLGFSRDDFTKPTSALSGGWRMRIELAKIILKKPDLLLLDEPTNHLDIESIQWLESFLSAYPGALILISHDRTFLDNVTVRTVEIGLGKIRDYKFNYSKYVEVREKEMQQSEAEYENQQKRIKEIEKFIERFRYKATKAKQVQSRIKMLEKMERIELPESDASAMHFRFPPAPPSGKVAVEVENYAKSYDDLKVLADVNFIIKRNDFVAFVGKNGEGKSTLVKSVAGLLDYEGKIKLGHNIKIGYYAQNQADMLDVEKTVFETIDDAAVGEIRKNIRGILGAFLFSGEDIDKKVKVLSGGEKARLSLAKMLLTPVNLLILDEPTNHLDMLSKDILKNALLQYNGTLILVSHDRDFLRGLSDVTYEFRGGKVIEHLGGIDIFLEKRKLEHLKELELSKKKKEGEKAKKEGGNKEAWLKKKEQEKERRKLEKQRQKTEDEIAAAEREMDEISELLSSPAEDVSYEELHKRYSFLENYLEEKMTDWENICERLEAADEN